MRRWTRRQWILVAAAVVLWLVAVAACLLTAWSVAGAALATLVLLAALAVVDSGSEDARLLAKVNVLTKRADRTLQQVDGLEERLAKQMRSARRTVEETGTQSLEEIATFKLQMAAVVQQLAEINLHGARGVSSDELTTALADQVDQLTGRLEELRATVEDRGARTEASVQAGHDKVAEQVRQLEGGVGARLEERIAHLGADVERLAYEPVREVEAVLQLVRRYEPKEVTPTAGGWAMTPSGLLMLTQMVEERRPRLVVECGSGTSSVWLGYALRSVGVGRVVSLENDPAYAEKVRSQLRRHGLEDWVRVVDAPLVDVEVDGETFRWYAPEQTEGLHDIDLLVVDGPPASVQPQSRYPALPMLQDRLAPSAVVVLDDANRSEERAILKRWRARTPGLSQQPFTTRFQAVLSVEPSTAQHA